MKETDREIALAAGAHDQTTWNDLFRTQWSNSARVPNAVTIAGVPRKRAAEAPSCCIRFHYEDSFRSGANYRSHDTRDLAGRLPISTTTAGFALLATFGPTEADEHGTILDDAVRISKQAVARTGYLYQTHRVYPKGGITVHKEESVEHP